MIDKQTQLAWLDKQRSIVNDMIVNLPPDEQGQLLPELQVINVIEARVQEMTAVEYLEARTAMCDSYRKTAFDPCDGCPFDKAEPPCGCMEDEDPRIAVEIVQKWKEEHHD